MKKIVTNLDYKDTSNTPGNVISHTLQGKSAIAELSKSTIVTNNNVTTKSIVHITPLSNDATLKSFNYQPGDGYFTIYGDMDATNHWVFKWEVRS